MFAAVPGGSGGSGRCVPGIVAPTTGGSAVFVFVFMLLFPAAVTPPPGGGLRIAGGGISITSPAFDAALVLFVLFAAAAASRSLFIKEPSF